MRAHAKAAESCGKGLCADSELAVCDLSGGYTRQVVEGHIIGERCDMVIEG